MKSTPLFLAGLVAGLLSLGAYAQPGSGGGMGGMGPGMGGMDGGPRQAARSDCSKSKNPAQCEARHKARDACMDKKGPDHASCMEDNMPGPDCGKSKNPQRCQARQKMHEACKGKYGQERQQCVRDQKKPAASAAGQKKP